MSLNRHPRFGPSNRMLTASALLGRRCEPVAKRLGACSRPVILVDRLIEAQVMPWAVFAKPCCDRSAARGGGPCDC